MLGSAADAALVPEARVEAVWLNAAPAFRVDVIGELDTAVSLGIEDGRVSRVYAIRNPHKLARLKEAKQLSRSM